MTDKERWVAANRAIHEKLGYEGWSKLARGIGMALVGPEYIDGHAYVIEEYGWDRAADIIERIARREGCL